MERRVDIGTNNSRGGGRACLSECIGGSGFAAGGHRGCGMSCRWSLGRGTFVAPGTVVAVLIPV